MRTAFAPNLHFLAAISLLACPALFSCGDEGGTTPLDPEALASFELTAAAPVTEGTPFLLTVTAVGDEGSKPLTAFNGTVSLGCSNGSVAPASLTLANGRVTTSVTVNQDGQQTLTATAQGKDGTVDLNVLPEEVLASFELSATASPMQAVGFTLQVTAVGDRGSKPLTSYAGTVSLSSSKGNITPANVNLASGAAYVTVTLDQDGEQTLTATADGKTGSKVLQVAPTELLASFELATSGVPMKGFGFTLQVTAVGDQGSKPLTLFDGDVALATSKGTIIPATITLDDGVGSTTVTLDEDGELTLTAAADGKDGTLTVDVAEGFVLNGEIAFMSNQGGGWDFWKVSQGVPDPVRLTNNNSANGQEPTVWSPDGTRIAYESNRTGNREIYVANADGTGEVQLTDDPLNDRAPYWSHDGSKIVFTSNRDGDWEIFVMNADGTGVTQLTQNADVDASPTWSPDGSKIAWNHGNGIDLMNPDGTGKTTLTNSGGGAVWSPDGSKIHFSHDGNLFVINADGTGLLQLTNSSRGDEPGDWSPDGSKIAFHGIITDSQQAFDWEIFVINADGSGLVRLTDDPKLSRAPSWSPDGIWIAFWRPQGVWGIHSVSGVVVSLAHPFADTWYPAWR